MSNRLEREAWWAARARRSTLSTRRRGRALRIERGGPAARSTGQPNRRRGDRAAHNAETARAELSAAAVAGDAVTAEAATARAELEAARAALTEVIGHRHLVVRISPLNNYE